MAGLILLVALIALIALLVWLSGPLTRWIPLSKNWKTSLRVLIVAIAFPLIIVDEIIGKHQLEMLCKKNGIENADVSKAQGKRVQAEYDRGRFIPGMIMPIKESDIVFKDASNGETLIRYKNYYAMGGWLMRYTPLSMGFPQPMLFPSSCTTDYAIRNAIFAENNITLIK